MTGLRVCAECGAAPAAAGLDGGLCPRCLLRLALSGAEEGAPEGWFGPYRIIRVVGEGGMGRVYLAEQREPIWRQVAIKVIKLGMDTQSFIARFQSERQALALLEHPGIARIYDAGSTPDGRPYFAMEYVDGGIPVTEYCDTRRLTIRQRLALFQQICAAVHHAHLHGVIHRDIKPSNILVATRDDAADVKIIDFGIAKAAKPSPGAQAATLYTDDGALIGTPEYMSPEQAGSPDSAIDARTDVYSLGVLLYELVAGVLPYGAPMRSVGYFEVVRRIRAEDAVAPRARIAALGAAAEDIAAARGTDARSLMRELRGDLEWIALRAMRKESEERYSSAAELAEDVRRHLLNEPVKAGPPGVRYRSRKFIAKHRTGCVAAATVLVVACVAATLALTLRGRANEARAYAAEQAYIAAVNTAALDLSAGDPDAALAELATCDQQRRDWEWKYLMYRTDPSVATLTAGGSFRERGSIASFAFRADGRVLWHTDTSVEEWGGGRPASSRAAPGRVLALNERGTVCAIADSTGGLGVYDVSTFALLRRIDSGGARVVRAAFDRAGSRLAVALAGGRLDVWNADTGQKLRTVTAGGPEIRDTRLNAEGTTVAFSTADDTVRFSETREGSPIGRVTDDAAPGGRLALMPGGIWLLGALLDREAPEQAGVGLFELPGGELLRIYRSRDPIADIAFNAQGRSQYGFVSTTGEVQLCDGAEGCTALRRRTSEPANSIAFSPDSRLVYTGFGGPGAASIAVWDSATKGGTRIPGTMGPVRGFAFDASGSRLAVAVQDRVDSWSLHDGLLSIWGAHAAQVAAVAASADGSTFASAADNGWLRLWDAFGRELPPPTRADGVPVALALSPNGQDLAVATSGGAVRVWDRRSGAYRSQAAVRGARALAFRNDGSAVAVAGDEGVRILDAHDLKLTRSGGVSRRAAALSVGWSADGTRFAAGDSAGAVHVWSYLEPRAHQVLPGHSGPVRSVAFHPAGTRIASGSEDRTVRIWAAASGKLLITLLGNDSPVHTVAWSPDGETLVSGGTGVRLWQTRRGALKLARLPFAAAAQ